MVLPRLATRADADRALAEMIHLNKLLAIETANRDAALADTEAAWGGTIAGLTRKIEVRSQAVEAWARKHRRREFGEAQSLQLNHGTLAFRVHPRAVELVEGWT